MKSPNPRQQVLDDLENEISRIGVNPKHHVIICMDANESIRFKGRNRLKAFNRNSGLVDPLNKLHLHLEETPTHVKGSK